MRILRRRSATDRPFILGRTNAVKLSRAVSKYTPAKIWRRNRLLRKKRRIFAIFRDISKSRHTFDGPVLLDCSFNVAGFFARLAMFRSALGLINAEEIALVRNEQANIWSALNMGIKTVLPLPDFSKFGDDSRQKAADFLLDVKTRADFLNGKLPYDMPVDVILYDGVLKLTRQHTLEIGTEKTFNCVAMAFEAFSWVEEILNKINPSIVIVSHAASFYYASLAFIAMKKGIPVVLATSLYGMPKFVKITEPKDLYNYVDRPTQDEFTAIDDAKGDRMAAAAETYLNHRLAGETNDIGGIYAYRMRREPINREAICKKFGWDTAKPLQIIYMANWFDYPHTYGMTQFEDIYDYARVTLATVEKATQSNWLLKAHPCEDWYKGCKLGDIIKTEEIGHVAEVDKSWDSVELLKSVDAVITIHGTIGVEAPALGIPTMVADVGWYHDYDFVFHPSSREGYLDALTKSWWAGMDNEKARRNALLFACFHFCRPSWEKGMDMGDDTLLDKLYDTLPKTLSHREPVQREIDEMRYWYYSSSRCYHAFKVMKCDDFIASNVSA